LRFRGVPRDAIRNPNRPQVGPAALDAERPQDVPRLRALQECRARTPESRGCRQARHRQRLDRRTAFQAQPGAARRSRRQARQLRPQPQPTPHQH